MKKLLKINQKKNTFKHVLFLLVILFFYNPLFAKNSSIQVDSALEKANIFNNINNDSVFYYAKLAYSLSTEYNLPKKKYTSLILLTKTNILVGNYGKAIVNSLEAKQIVEQNGLSELVVEVDMLIGTSYLAMGFSNDALKYFLEVKNKTTNRTKYNLLIDLDYYIGSAYSEINDLVKANKYLHSSIAIAVSNNYSLGAYKSYILLTALTDNLDTVNKYNNLANNVIIEHPKLLYKKVVLRNNQAFINKAIGNLELSKKQYTEAINISIDKGFQDHLSNLYNNYAYLLIAEKKLDSSAIVLAKALTIAKSIQNTDLQASIYDSYSDYFSYINDYKNALIYKDSSITKRKQYREEQQVQASLFLTAVFETEQKEIEIINQEKEILEKENRINQFRVFQVLGLASLIFVIGLVLYFRQKFQLGKSRLQTVEINKELEIADAMISGQDSERERIAMDLHDGLAARLSNMRFFIDTNFYSNDKFTELTNYITSIHQNIRELSHRMQPIQLKRVGLKATIGELAETINNSKKFKVDFITDIENRLPEKIELNIYYLINELVNNATKHSTGNKISIQLYIEDNNSITLSVEDNGKDFIPEKSSKGSGLRNIESRVKYLGGKLLVESSGQNTTFFIEIPNKS